MRSKFSQRWWMIVAALAFVSVLAAHLVEPSAISVPNSAEAQSGSSNVQSTGNELEEEQPTDIPSRDMVSAADVETERRFNELRRELLDSREKMVDWWLAATAVILTSLGVVAAIVGFFGFKSVRSIETKARKSMEEAKKHAEEAKNYVQETKRSRDEAALHLKGMTAEAAHDNPDKTSEAVKVVQQNPDSTLIDKAVATAFSLQSQNEIEEAIKKWISIAGTLEGIDNERAAASWFSVGYLRSSKNVDEAIKAYDKSIELNPNFYQAYNNRGSAKVRIGQYNSAIVDLNKALSYKSDFAEAYCNRGLAKINLNQYNSAIEDYDVAIALKRDDAEAYCNRGIAKASLGQYHSAITDFDEALNRKPDFAEAYSIRGEAKANLSQYHSAIIDCDEALNSKPNFAEAYCNRAKAKVGLRQYHSAITDCDKALNSKPDFAEAYCNRGVARCSIGQYDSAIADFDKALNSKPDFAEVYRNRGLVKLIIGQYESAVTDCDEALVLKSDDAEAYYLRGIAKTKLDRIDGAQQDLRKAHSLAQAVGNVDLAAQASSALSGNS